MGSLQHSKSKIEDEQASKKRSKQKSLSIDLDESPIMIPKEKMQKRKTVAPPVTKKPQAPVLAAR